VSVVAFVVLVAPAGAEPPPPEVAEILEPATGGAPLNPADVHMEAVYADENGDPHECSDWQIWILNQDEGFSLKEPVWEARCATGLSDHHIHLGDGTFVNSYSGHTALDYETHYRLCVRFRGGGEWSADDEDHCENWATRDFSTVPPGPKGIDTDVPWTARPGYLVEKVASGFKLPVNIATVPNPGPHPGSPLFYVAELYGGIKVVTRDGVVRQYAKELLNYDPNGIFPGSGEQGLTGLAVDPASGDLFASMVYAEREVFEEPHYEKVIRLHSNERGWEALGEPETVLDMKELEGASHQISHLEITPDGYMFVHNADGGEHSNTDPEKNPATRLDSFRGKILRMTLDGEPVGGPTDPNPYYDPENGISAEDYVYSLGYRNPFGGAWRLSDSTYWSVENGPKRDRLALVVKGKNYGWEGLDSNMTIGATYNWYPAHAPVNIEFVEPGRFGGSEFPAEAMGHAFVTESGPTYASGPQEHGKRIVEFGLGDEGEPLSGPETLVEYSGTGRATAVGLAADAEGLLFTELYPDHPEDEGDEGDPEEAGARVLRVRYCGEDCPVDGEASAAPPPKVDRLPPPVDRLRPAVSHFHALRKVFSVRPAAKRGVGAPRARRGTAFVYHLSEPATTWIEISRVIRRRVVDGHCRRPSRHWRLLGRRHRRCLLIGQPGALTAPGSPGLDRRRFGGRLGHRLLRLGRYRATIRARAANGNESTPRTTAFRVVPDRSRPVVLSASPRRGRSRRGSSAGSPGRRRRRCCRGSRAPSPAAPRR
jgi:glucose/arabinose dehydrogenase